MKKKLFKSTLTVGIFTLLSRIAGFLRDIVLAKTFGSTMYMEAFLVAFKIPNFMRRLFAEGSFTQAFVPVLADYKSNNNHNELINFIRTVIGVLGVSLIILTSISMVCSSTIVIIFAPGFLSHPEKLNLAANMLVITFPYIFSIALVALSGSIMNCFSKFSVPAFTPVLLNITLIIFAHYSEAFSIPIYSIAWAVFTAGFIQLIFQIPFLLKLNISIIPRYSWKHPGVKKLLKLMIPAVFGASVAQISLLLDTIFASFLPTGSISWLYYSDRLNQFPLGVFGIALSTVILPHLSTEFSKKNILGYERSVTWAIKMVLIFAIPAAIGLIILSAPLLITLFNYGKFSTYDVIQTQDTLIAFSFGLFSFILIKVLVSVFYSRHNFKTPVKIAIFALFCNFCLNLILINILKKYQLGHVGLAISTSISAFINVALLLKSLVKQKIYIPKLNSRFTIRLIISNLIMAVILYSLMGYNEQWFKASFSERTIWLLVLILTGFTTYMLSLFILGFRKKDLQPNF